MAIATATAIALGGLAISAGSTAMSFSQASKQSKLQREAEAKAAQAMAEARKKLNVNFAKNLSIQKEPYELAREAMLSTGAQALQASIESDRGPEVAAGKIQMAQNQGQADIRSVMGQELTDINKQVINEESRLRDLNAQLDLGEVEGAQLAARDAQEARTSAMTQGFQGLASMGQQALAMVPLYQKQNPPISLEGATVTGDTKPTSFLMNPINQQFQNSINTAPLASVGASPIFGPQRPVPGTEYGPFGINWSGVGY